MTRCGGFPIRGLLVAMSLLLGCAASAPIRMPQNLPYRSQDQLFEFRYAIQKANQGRIVRAVGWVSYDGIGVMYATLELYGLDQGGSTVSRGQTQVDCGFEDQSPQPFRITLTPAGTESHYAIRVLHAAVDDEQSRLRGR